VSETISMPVNVFIDGKYACSCTKLDAPIRVAAYQKLFKKARVEALSALQAGKAGYIIPKTRGRAGQVQPEPKKVEE